MSSFSLGSDRLSHSRSLSSSSGNTVSGSDRVSNGDEFFESKSDDIKWTQGYDAKNERNYWVSDTGISTWWDPNGVEVKDDIQSGIKPNIEINGVTYTLERPVSPSSVGQAHEIDGSRNDKDIFYTYGEPGTDSFQRFKLVSEEITGVGDLPIGSREADYKAAEVRRSIIDVFAENSGMESNETGGSTSIEYGRQEKLQSGIESYLQQNNKVNGNGYYGKTLSDRLQFAPPDQVVDQLGELVTFPIKAEKNEATGEINAGLNQLLDSLDKIGISSVITDGVIELTLNRDTNKLPFTSADLIKLKEIVARKDRLINELGPQVRQGRSVDPAKVDIESFRSTGSLGTRESGVGRLGKKYRLVPVFDDSPKVSTSPNPSPLSATVTKENLPTLAKVTKPDLEIEEIIPQPPRPDRGRDVPGHSQPKIDLSFEPIPVRILPEIDQKDIDSFFRGFTFATAGAGTRASDQKDLNTILKKHTNDLKFTKDDISQLSVKFGSTDTACQSLRRVLDKIEILINDKANKSYSDQTKNTLNDIKQSLTDLIDTFEPGRTNMESSTTMKLKDFLTQKKHLTKMLREVGQSGDLPFYANSISFGTEGIELRKELNMVFNFITKNQQSHTDISDSQLTDFRTLSNENNISQLKDAFLNLFSTDSK
ncbi:hypothetical protein DID75_04750 [Candidatus Marinamargulisbacteria bacterium SCGC AG-410-N11]|nr:hypothetical protein DID75_04750 [Candidatus Marinamargulisbacteria bacterium SCGC AG-410-N11]